jgi:PTH1 family peptidyl-tRNA hydrolase
VADLSEQALRLIVGLGNPGPDYADTRHNIGFQLLDTLARRSGSLFRMEKKFKGEACRISMTGHSLWLLKPMTYMNRSGESIASFAHFYKLSRPSILVVHDEIDLPPGTLRLKKSGGHGGNNGVRDIINHLGGDDFLRLRIGVGHPGNKQEVMHYVLRRAPESERQLLEDAIALSLKVLPQIVNGQLEQAMNTLHSRKSAAVTES